MQALMSERDVMAKVLIVVQPFAALVEVEDVAFACAGGTQLSPLVNLSSAFSSGVREESPSPNRLS